ncbi:hypothetical protein [Arthrobacter sp. SF27]|uniref:hypothetical protein n=1 Tax=Crystallibacter degradans TaxID=2726743 RepID=UPI001475BDDC|nr:hypothetical protein [Arthrobacter sp. SF27]NMR32185.1 hypothetical protein [Arthrobacter sp. SF27]
MSMVLPDLSHPAVNLWEHRQTLAWLSEQGRRQVNEQALLGMIDQMREIASIAQRDVPYRGAVEMVLRVQQSVHRRVHISAFMAPRLPQPLDAGGADVARALKVW